jgi:hypothetical protein
MRAMALPATKAHTRTAISAVRRARSRNRFARFKDTLSNRMHGRAECAVSHDLFAHKRWESSSLDPPAVMAPGWQVKPASPRARS